MASVIAHIKLYYRKQSGPILADQTQIITDILAKLTEIQILITAMVNKYVNSKPIVLLFWLNYNIICRLIWKLELESTPLFTFFGETRK